MFSDRIKQFIDYQNLSVRSFEEESLITQGIVSRTIKNKLVLSGDNLIKISKRWPSLNLEWLLTGESEMIKSEENKLKETLTKAEQDVIYWKNLVDTLSLAVQEKYKPEVQKNINKTFTEEEAIKLLLSYQSKGSDIQRMSFEIHERYVGICKLFKRGIREPAIELSKELLETAVWYQEYSIATELTKYLVNHYAIYGSKITSNEYMDLYEKYSSMANLEFRARQIFNKVCYNQDHYLEINKNEIENALNQIQSIMLLDSFNYYAYYYKSKCLLSEGEELLKWTVEAITYFENQYFKHESIISHFKSLLVTYYCDNDAIVEAFSVLNKAIKETSSGSYAWFKYKYSYIELLVKEDRLKEAGENFELATNHEVFTSLADDDKQYWEVLRKLVYDDETVKYRIES